MTAGRPSSYTKELADRICARLAAGESMRTVCKDEDLPSAQTLFSWMRVYPEFLEQYARAKEESADALVEETLDIADNGTNDWMEKNNAEGDCIGYTLNGEHVQRSRLRVETRKWMASKLKPKKYGEKVQTEHALADSLTALLTQIAQQKPGLPDPIDGDR
jgi:hypothetical protein